MWNPVEISFLFLAASVGVTGEMITRWRKHLPDLILQSYLYGSFAHRGKKSTFANRFEIPKSAFRHFYVFAAVASSAAMLMMALVYTGKILPPPALNSALMFLLLQDKPSVCVTAAISSMLLLTIQIYRRLYETQRLQVFASHSRINLSHYIAGFTHYLGCVITVVGQAPLFSGETQVQGLDAYTAVSLLPCSAVFLRAWYEQYKTNVIFSSLRRDKSSGAVVTEAHGVPEGRWFKTVSSPHRLTEVMMYTSLLVLFPTRTFFCIYLWVVLNQIQTAVIAHDWYKNNFKNYPKERSAIFPKWTNISLNFF